MVSYFRVGLYFYLYFYTNAYMSVFYYSRITRVLIVVNDQVAGESNSRILVMLYDLFREGSKLNYALNILENIARVNPRVVNQRKELRMRNDLGHGK